MNNAFANENEGETLKRLLDRALLKNSGLNLGLSIYIKNLVSVFIYSLFKLSYYLSRLNKYFFICFAK